MNAVRGINGCEPEGKEWAKSCLEYPSSKGTPFVSFIHPGDHKYPAEAPGPDRQVLQAARAAAARNEESRTMIEANTSRRGMLKALAGLGIGSAIFHRAVAAGAAEGPVTVEMLKQAAWIAGIELTEAEQNEVAKAVERDRQKFDALRKVEVDYSVPPAIVFHAAPPQEDGNQGRGEVRLAPNAAIKRPADDEDLAFLPVTELAALVRTKQVSSRRTDEALPRPAASSSIRC